MKARPLLLPIDPLLPDIVRLLRRDRRLVVEAEPGAGKTTRVPRAILEAELLSDQEIVVLEPRRIAARMAAHRVAAELGEPVGERVGYAVRFDQRSSPKTRLRFVTEGVFLRMITGDPSLQRVGCVVFDEFHERSLEADLALALTLRLADTRPDLALVPMSATLDGARLAAHLGCERVRAEGRRFPVRIEHDRAPDDRPLALRITAALREVLRAEPSGHVLVFVPGAREIRDVLGAAARVVEEAGAVLLPLHGELPPDEQDRALAPSERRKIVVSTNVAESSVTLDGVVAVIDSGLVRRVTSSPWTGLPVRTTEKTSRASAAQRAGRAGRTREGLCRRLYTKGDHDARREHDPPGIARDDLTELRLLFAKLGHSLSDARWLDAPQLAAIERAERLLERLGALDRGALTGLGGHMAELAVHPRLAALAIFAAERGAPRDGALLAALLGERDPRRARRASLGDGGRGATTEAGDSDVLSVVDALSRARAERLRPAELRALELDPEGTRAVLSAATQLDAQLTRLVAPRAREDRDETLAKALLVAFSDRVARRRRPGSRELVLSGGGSARQAEESEVVLAPFVVVVRAEETARGVVARELSRIEPEWLLELFPAHVTERTRVLWDDERARADAVSELLFDDLVLDGGPARDDDETRRALAALVAERALAKGLHAIVKDTDALEGFLSRARFVREHDPSFPSFEGEALRAVVAELAVGTRSLAELAALGFPLALEARLSPAERTRLAEWAPERLLLSSGRHAKITYEPGRPPFVSSRLQDFFGMTSLPSVAGGRAALTAHLLAPSQRPVQVTSDLAGFWARHYPSIRRELCRRYPKHAWPEDPMDATRSR